MEARMGARVRGRVAGPRSRARKPIAENLTDVWQRQRQRQQRTLTLFACVPVPRINSWLQPLATASPPLPLPWPLVVPLYCGCAGRQQIETNSRIGVRIAIEIGFAWAGLGRCKCHPPLALSSPPPGGDLLLAASPRLPSPPISALLFAPVCAVCC